MTHAPALVISLDFELHWGVRDHVSSESVYWSNLVGARDAVVGILELFREFEVAATWATVGFLFALDRDEQSQFSPPVRPTYRNRILDPFSEAVGRDESDDPMHFAPSLIDLIRETPRQELGSHTFSHYYCLEPGQTAEQFSDDLLAAKAIAKAKGVKLESLVLPRNQCNPEYLQVIREAGFTCFRGCESHWAYQSLSSRSSWMKRAFRLVDSFINLSGSHLADWPSPGSPIPIDVPASRFLRPVTGHRILDDLSHRRVANCLREAAKQNKIFHLWWHPHNFGKNTQRNLDWLRKILEVYRECFDSRGMKSLTMGEVADVGL